MILNPYGVHILCNFSSPGSRLRRQPGAIDISPLRGSSIIKHLCTGIRAKWRHLIALYNAPYKWFNIEKKFMPKTYAQIYMHFIFAVSKRENVMDNSIKKPGRASILIAHG